MASEIVLAAVGAALLLILLVAACACCSGSKRKRKARTQLVYAESQTPPNTKVTHAHKGRHCSR